MQIQNSKIILKKKPGPDYPEINDVFEVNQIPLPNPNTLKDGQIILQTLYLSIDAAMRVWITGVKTYFDPVLPSHTMPGLGVARVLHSKSPKLQAGDIVSGLLLWQKFLVTDDKKVKKISSKSLSEQQMLSALGPLGISGLTAYTGFENIGKPKQGEVVVVSAAAGAVGEIAIQLAKNHYKCKVIGIAGGPEKCKYVLEQLGADACIDYHKDNIEKALKELAKDGVDVYFDNVGGEQLDAVLMNIKMQSRIILCGAISQYNKTRNELYRIKNYPRLIIKKALMQGFIYTDYQQQFSEGIKVLNNLTSQGQLKVRYDIFDGLEQAPTGLQRLLLGKNQGKVIVRVVQYDQINPKL